MFVVMVLPWECVFPHAALIALPCDNLHQRGLCAHQVTVSNPIFCSTGGTVWHDGTMGRRVEEAAPCHDFPPAYQTQGWATTGDRAGLRRSQPLLTNVSFLRNLLVYVSTYVIRSKAF